MKKFRIYQLKENPENRDIMFASHDALNRPVNLDRYACVYEGTMQPNDNLDALFARFNTDFPADYTGRSLSVSDIILTQDNGNMQAFYVEPVGFHEITEEIQDRIEKIEEYVPLYRKSFTYAKSHDEMDDYRASRKENIRCRKEIDEVVNQHFDGMHLDTRFVRPLLDQYGADRIEWVMANTLMLKSYDGRFSHKNRDWATTIGVPHERDSFGWILNSDFELRSHPTLLEGFISYTRAEIDTIRNRPSVREALRDRQASIQNASPAEQQARQDVLE